MHLFVELRFLHLCACWPAGAHAQTSGQAPAKTSAASKAPARKAPAAAKAPFDAALLQPAALRRRPRRNSTSSS